MKEESSWVDRIEENLIAVILGTMALLTFANVSNPSLQTDNLPTTATSGSITEVNYVAKYAIKWQRLSPCHWCLLW